MKVLLSTCLVGVHTMEGAAAFRAFQQLEMDGDLDMRILMQIPEENLDAAIQAGDIRETGVNEMESLWFLHHIAVMIKIKTMPETPTFEYRKNTHALLEDVLRYSLRGIGMTDEAIKQHANPSQLARALDAVMQAPLSLDPR